VKAVTKESKASKLTGRLAAVATKDAHKPAVETAEKLAEIIQREKLVATEKQECALEQNLAKLTVEAS